jgi:putative peptidoglycan lipid II flippase
MASGNDSATGPSDLSSVERLGRSAGLAGAATLTSRILGLARETVLASTFGAGNEMDAFTVAFRIPNLIRDLFAEGAMSAAFVPTFTRHLTLKGRTDAWRLGNNLLNALLVTTGSIVVLGCLLAGPIVSAYAESYARVPGKLELTIQLTRVVWPFLTMAAVAAAVMGMLNSLHHYFVPALSPATFNVATIVAAIVLTPLMPSLGLPRIMSIAIGALVGGLAQIAIQWPALRREGFRYAPYLDFRDPGLRQVLLLMGPGTVGLAATQVNLFVNTVLATSQGTGAVSWLQYAFRLMYLPIGVFGVSIATAVLPSVARHAAVDDRDGIRRTVAHGIALMLVLNVPATIGLLVLAAPIVQVLLERGHFTGGDTIATAAAVRYYAIGLVGYSASRIASPVFYALRRSRVAVMLSTVAVLANLGLSVTLVRVLGFRGLALATSLAAILNGGLALVLLHRALGGLDARRLAVTLLKTLAASAAMAAVILVALTVLPGMTSDVHPARRAIRLLILIVAGLVTLAGAARVLHIAEFDEVVDDVRRRFGKT